MKLSLACKFDSWKEGRSESQVVKWRNCTSRSRGEITCEAVLMPASLLSDTIKRIFVYVGVLQNREPQVVGFLPRWVCF